MVQNEKSRSAAEKGYLGFCLFSHCYAAESALLGLILIIITIIIIMVHFTLKHYYSLQLRRSPLPSDDVADFALFSAVFPPQPAHH